ncbi:MAG TPA: D-2-hydroxyacid dehydrogenase, partial [Armatimonadota bacterium]
HPLTILITAKAPIDALRPQIAAIAPDARIVTREDVDANPALLAAMDIVFGTLMPEEFPRASRLRWLQTTFAGMEWTAHPAIRSHPALLTNARIHGETISEHLFGMLLMLTRQLHVAYRQQLTKQIDRAGYLDNIDVLAGKTLCVVGLGAIGQRCAALGAAFGMRVIGVRRHPQPTPAVEQVYGDEGLHQALAQSDVVMVVLPNTPDTRKLFGPAEFAALKKGAYFLNAGRGQTVDTDALLSALRDGTLYGAGLDVVDPEPLPIDHPLWEMPNVILTPHVSGALPDYMATAARVFLDNLRRFVAGEPLRFVIDKEAGY